MYSLSDALNVVLLNDHVQVQIEKTEQNTC